MIQKPKRPNTFPGDSLGKKCFIMEGITEPTLTIKSHALYVNHTHGVFHNLSEEPGRWLGGLGCSGCLVGALKKGETLTTGRLRFYDPELWPASEDQIVPFNIILDLKDRVLNWIGENIKARWTVVNYFDGEKDRWGLAFLKPEDAVLFKAWFSEK